ncbi:hypothetical protein HDU84_002856 [Entophlyctis sp. JEL0112]|nr:hypothetical protein HDU84_002856 [Entophlyctis sp. JEL0112]
MERQWLWAALAAAAVLAATNPPPSSLAASSGRWVSWLSPKSYSNYFLFSLATIAVTGDIYLGALGAWVKLPFKSNDHLLNRLADSALSILPHCTGGCGSGICVANEFCLCAPGYFGPFCSFERVYSSSRLSDSLQRAIVSLSQILADPLLLLLLAPLVLHFVFILFPNRRRQITLLTTLDSRRPHSLITSCFFHANTWRLLFSFIPFYDYAWMIASVVGRINTSALILWCAFCASLGSLHIQRGTRVGGLSGVVAGLRLFVIAINMQTIADFGGFGWYDIEDDMRYFVHRVVVETAIAYFWSEDFGAIVGGLVGGFLAACALGF